MLCICGIFSSWGMSVKVGLLSVHMSLDAGDSIFLRAGLVVCVCLEPQLLD